MRRLVHKTIRYGVPGVGALMTGTAALGGESVRVFIWGVITAIWHDPVSLVVCVAGSCALFLLWVWTGREDENQNGLCPSSTTHGHHSPALSGVFHGGVTFNDLGPPPQPAATHDLEIVFPPESEGGIFAYNKVEATAKFHVGGKNHFIGNNAFGRNAEVPKWPREPTNEKERREDLVSEILDQWTILHQHDNPFPFPFPDEESLFAATKDFIDAELERRGEQWRLTIDMI